MNDFAGAVQAGLLGGLQAMRGVLDAAAAHATEQDIELDDLLQAQLFEDMFPFWRQVPSACNVARRCVDRLSGGTIHDPPRPEPTLEALRAHLEETMGYVKAADARAIAATESAELTAKLAKQPVPLTGRTYLTNFALPNLLFHVVTAYNILRSKGVPLGKHSYLRPLITAGAPQPAGEA